MATATAGPSVEAPLLPHTVQTWVGMVLDQGNPRCNDYSHPKFTPLQEEQNEAACRNADVQLDDLKKLISIRRRIDMEKVVALTLSVQEEADRILLIPHIQHLIESTWMTPAPHEPLFGPDLQIPRNPLQSRINTVCLILGTSKGAPQFLFPTPTVDPPTYLDSLVALVLAARRKRPKLENKQSLALPDALKGSDASRGTQFKPYVISKKVYGRLLRVLRRMDGPRDDEALFIRSVKTLAQEIELSANRRNALLKSDDPLAVGFSFVELQRRLQLKIVSDANDVFLPKGEGALVIQNRPDVLTTFELAVAKRLVQRQQTDWAAASAVLVPPGAMQTLGESEVARLDQSLLQTCLFMQRYVDLFGQGNLENLTFKVGVSGGSGRGPVDFYNLLVDVLRDVKSRLEARGVKVEMGPCHKFLAKDIMSWNNAWKDDAFADGKIPGWVDYLEKHSLRSRYGEQSK